MLVVFLVQVVQLLMVLVVSEAIITALGCTYDWNQQKVKLVAFII